LLPLGFLTFTLFGVVLVLVGASHESLSAALGLRLDQMAVLGASLQLGLGAGVVVAGPLVDRLPRRPLFCVASGIAALALLSVESEMSFARAILHVVAVGFGGGLCETTINTMTVERFGERSIRPLTLLHSAATLGAVAAPPLVGMLISGGDWTTSFRATGAGWAMVSVGALFVSLPAPRAAAPERAKKTLVSPSLVALFAVAFAYVGLETAVTLFAVPYASDVLVLGADRGRDAISSFWLGLLVGRLLIVVLTARSDARFLVGGGLAAALILAAGVGFGWTQLELLVGLCGVSVGFVFPLMVALTGEWFPESTGTATGFVVGAGCLGGFAIPWLTGAIAETTGVAVAVGSLAFWALCIAAAAQAARVLRRA
jgi:FHS family glucose/mannose:H+ symporter-like MFS transporter